MSHNMSYKTSKIENDKYTDNRQNLIIEIYSNIHHVKQHQCKVTSKLRMTIATKCNNNVQGVMQN